jgi:hypothetical protein
MAHLNAHVFSAMRNELSAKPTQPEWKRWRSDPELAKFAASRPVCGTSRRDSHTFIIMERLRGQPAGREVPREALA